jgi:hypothetical protein
MDAPEGALEATRAVLLGGHRAPPDRLYAGPYVWATPPCYLLGPARLVSLEADHSSASSIRVGRWEDNGAAGLVGTMAVMQAASPRAGTESSDSRFWANAE